MLGKKGAQRKDLHTLNRCFCLQKKAELIQLIAHMHWKANHLL